MNTFPSPAMLGRLSLAFIYVWFGILKTFGASPAIPLVDDLAAVVIPFVDPDTFNVLFGLFEVMIGAMFLFPRADRATVPLFLCHMAATLLPLVVLPAATWTAPFVPTLVGQYILKNVALLALVGMLINRKERAK